MQYSIKSTTLGVFQLAREGNLEALKLQLKDVNYQEVEVSTMLFWSQKCYIILIYNSF